MDESLMSRVSPRKSDLRKRCVLPSHARFRFPLQLPRLQLIAAQAPRTSLQLAMDRAAKRLASIQHVQSKDYYSGEIEGPDPLDNQISTRQWKYLFNLWVRALKEAHRQRSVIGGA